MYEYTHCMKSILFTLSIILSTAVATAGNKPSKAECTDLRNQSASVVIRMKGLAALVEQQPENMEAKKELRKLIYIYAENTSRYKKDCT